MLRVGVVGVGHLGAHHARIYGGLDGVSLVGVHDIDAARGETVASQCGSVHVPSLEALLDAVDAVSIVVPTAEHAQVAEPALERGLAVLVEKPLAPSAADGRALLEFARRYDAPLMVGHIERWNGAFRSIVPHVSTPRFIEAHRLAAFPGRGLDVDVVRDLMIHDLDLVLALARAPLTGVQAVGVCVLTRRADIANARLEFEDGMVANLTASRASREPVRKMRIFQDDAYLSCDFASRSAEFYRRRPAADGGNPVQSAMALLAAVEHRKFGPIDDPDPLTAELMTFVEGARSGRLLESTGEDGVAALELAERITESMASAAERMGVEMSIDGAALPAAAGTGPAEDGPIGDI